MKNSTLLKTGITGTVVLAVCCFTPVLVVLLAGLGLSALVGMLDYVLLPLLAICVAITLFALAKRVRS